MVNINVYESLFQCCNRHRELLLHQCAGLSKTAFAALPGPDVEFFCPQCRLSKYETLLSEFKSVVDTLENRVKILERQVQCTDYTGNLPTNTQASPQISVKSRDNKITGMVNSLLNEKREKSRYRLNTIVHNVTGSTAEDGLTRKQQDIEVVTSLFQQHLGISSSISRAFRLDQKHEKPRLLKIPVISDAEKTSILRNSIKFRYQ